MPCTTLQVTAAPTPEVGDVTIKVVDAYTGEPVSGACVVMATYMDITDASGIVVFTTIEGKYSVRITHEQYEPEETTVTVPGTYTVRIEPVPVPPPGTGNVWGIVTDYRGVPAGGVEVVMAGRTDITEDNGRYEFLDIPAGTYTIKYYFAEWEYTETVEIIAGETVRKDLAVYPIYYR